MKKLLSLTILVFAGAFLLAGCGSKLPDGMDEETVLTAAHTVIESLEQKDYDAVVETMDDNLKQALPAEKLAEVWEPIAEQAGAFSGYEKEAVTEKKGWGVAVVVARYEKSAVQFTLSFDSEMHLGGLYLK